LILSKSEFPITTTSEKAIDKAAIIGVRYPNAATGIANTL
jgi:hypothetical protein